MIKLLSLFSGIGAFETALRRGGYQFETVNYCEIDPYASKAYSQIHGISEDYNLKDVHEVNPLIMDNVNLLTWGWPCQDISIAGKQRGFTDSDGNFTRSGLFFEGLRILETLQPEYAIAENVKALTGKKFTAEFETVLTSLDKAGYNNYWKVLNAKDYGVPQNRERVFIVSIRKDIDTGAFTFPEKQPLQLRVKDMLEPVVDEKYYINNERAESLIRQILAKTDTNLQETDIKVNNIGTYNNHQSGIVNDPNGLSRCLTAVDYKDPVKIIEKIKWCGSVNGHQSWAVIHEDGCCCCLNVAGHVEPQKIMVSNPKIMQVGNVVDTGHLEVVKIKRLGNLYDENAGGARAGNVYAPDGLAPALQTAQGGNRQPLIFSNDPVICRSVGRDPDNPSNREKGCNTEQTLELKKDGLSNTLTTVQKDNMVLEPKIKNIGSINGHQSGNVLHQDSDLSPCLCVAGHVEPQKIMVSNPKIMQVENIVDTGNFDNPQRGRIYDPNGLSPALNTMQGGGLQPHILINPDVCGNDVCRTIKSQYHKTSTANFERTGTQGATGVLDVTNYRIRKLTPRECFRLMGFTDEDFNRIHGISNTQLYKMAGNSIVVNVLEAIFKQLFKENHK